MNTFLPFSDFRKSAEALDNKRLGKQRVEVLQIARCIAYESSGWTNHPATKMWRPYLNCLIHYGLVCCDVWQMKGFKDTVGFQLTLMQEGEIVNPPWLGSHRLHSSHRGMLANKDPAFYRWEKEYDYFWPDPFYDWRKESSDYFGA